MTGTRPTEGQLAAVGQRAADALWTILNRLPDTLAALDTCRNGFPSDTLAGGSTSGGYGGETTSATERAALTPDRARAALDRLIRDIVAAEVSIHAALGTVTAWAPLANPSRPAGCRSCARNRRHFEPVKARGLCSWCDEFTRRHIQWLPLDGQDYVPVALLELHHTGRRITSADLARHLPGYQPDA